VVTAASVFDDAANAGSVILSAAKDLVSWHQERTASAIYRQTTPFDEILRCAQDDKIAGVSYSKHALTVALF
jgi:hypothetical protein